MCYSHATNQVFSHRGQRFIEIELVLPEDLLYVLGSVVGNVQARSMTLNDCTYSTVFSVVSTLFFFEIIGIAGVS